MVRPILVSALSAPLAACMSMQASPVDTMPPPSAEDSCEAAKAQAYIGKIASASVGAELLRITGSREIRWVPPGTIVTADFKYGRLTVDYDDGMLITRIACG